MLQACFALNIFFVFVGFVALGRWLNTHDPSNQELTFLGFGVFTFGIVLPAWLFQKLTQKLIAVRRQTEKIVAQYVAQWLETLAQFKDKEPLQDPKFWINMVLILFETIGENSRHPGMQALAEIAPILRHEIKSAERRKGN